MEAARTWLLLRLTCERTVSVAWAAFAGKSLLAPLLLTHARTRESFMKQVVLADSDVWARLVSLVFEVMLSSIPKLGASLWYALYVTQTNLAWTEVLSVCMSVLDVVYTSIQMARAMLAERRSGERQKSGLIFARQEVQDALLAESSSTPIN